MALSIKKIDVDRLEKDFFLCTRYNDQKRLYIRLLNITDAKAYTGEASDAELRSVAAEAHMSFSEYLENTLSAVSYDNPENFHFVYTLEENGNMAVIFKWKKVLEEDIKITLGNVTLSRKDYPTILANLLIETSSELSYLNIKVKEQTEALQKSEKQQSEYYSALCDAVKAKEDLEKELYAKFLVVLNCKKQKIRELHQKLESSEKKKACNKQNSKGSIITGRKHEYNPYVSSNDILNEPGPSKIQKKNSPSLFQSDDSDDINSTVKQLKQRDRKRNLKSAIKEQKNALKQFHLEDCDNSNEAVTKSPESDDELFKQL